MKLKLYLYALVACLAISQAVMLHSQTSPTTLPLVQAGNFQYLGQFALPKGSDDAHDTSYGGHALGLGPNNTLYFGGHDHLQRLCQTTIPAIGGTGEFVGAGCVEPPDELGAGAGTPILGGTLLWNNRLILSQFIFYDGDGSAKYSHSTASPDRTNFTNPVKVGTLNPGYYAGYMGAIPSEWRTLLGGPALTGQALLSIVSRTSYGPAAFVFDPDNVGRVSPVPAAPLVYYTQANPISNPDNTNPYVTFADTVAGIAFPSGTRSVLFIGRHGTGSPGYGPARCGYQGYCSDPYTSQVWAYDANDLLKVKQGQLQPWAVRPYAMFPLPGNVGDAKTTRKGGAVFDPVTRRLYLAGDYGESPRVHVYEITAGTAALPPVPGPPPPPAPGPVACTVSSWSTWQATSAWSACTNGTRTRTEQRTRSVVTPASNGGTACPALTETRTASQSCSATAPVPAEVCNDGLDNDNDGEIDENCGSPAIPATPGTPRRLLRNIVGSTVFFSWSAPITGGPTAGYVLDAGLSPGTTVYSTPVPTNQISVPNVGPGRYYVRVRAVNAGGASPPSNEVTVSMGCSSRPRKPRSFKAQTNGGNVAMTWVDEDGCDGTRYRLDVGSSSGSSNLASAPVDVESVAAVAPAGTYFARVVTMSSFGDSEPSDEFAITVDNTACAPPNFETDLDVVMLGRQVALTWSPSFDESANAADDVLPVSYVLEIGSAPGAANLGAIDLGRATALQGAAPPGNYYVRIRPANACGQGQASNEFVIPVR